MSHRVSAHNTSNDVESRECILQHALDRHERCPGDMCPFWADGACRLDDLRPDVETNPELAGFLLDLRARMMGGDDCRLFRRVGTRGSR